MNFLSFLTSYLLLPAGFFLNFDPKVIPRDTHKVTILVHGFVHNQSIWYYLQSFLAKRPDVGPIFTLNLGHPFQSIDAYSKILQSKIDEIKKMVDVQTLEIQLVGHSMGGLVCLNYAANYAADDVWVTKIITIASPLQGTNTAYLAKLWSPAGNEMTPSSKFLKTLKSEIKRLEGRTKIYHIGCGRDWVVPCDNTCLDGRELDVKLPKMGHFTPLFSPKVADQIAGWLLEIHSHS